jgi:hypothetical protein
MPSRETCVDCKKQSPETETNYTLIGSRHGWRLSREKLPDGKVLVEWRCADCWKLHKATQSESAGRQSVTATSTPATSPSGGPKRSSKP